MPRLSASRDLVEQVVQLAEQAGERAAVEQTGDGAEQVAEQVAGAGRRDDVGEILSRWICKPCPTRWGVRDIRHAPLG
jgi:hypothetical protein